MGVALEHSPPTRALVELRQSGVMAANMMRGRDWIAAGFLTESTAIEVIGLHDKCGSPAPLAESS